METWTSNAKIIPSTFLDPVNGKNTHCETEFLKLNLQNSFPYWQINLKFKVLNVVDSFLFLEFSCP